MLFKLREAYNYLFYYIHQAIVSGGEKDVPTYTSVFVISVIQGFNIFSLILIFDLLGFHIVPLLIDKTVILVLAIILILLNSLYFLSKKRHKKVISYFDQKNIRYLKRGKVIVLMYILLSIVLVFILAPLR